MNERPTFPIAFRGLDPDRVAAHLEELEVALAEQAVALAVAAADARLAELDLALRTAHDASLGVAERTERLEVALQRLRQSVADARSARSAS